MSKGFGISAGMEAVGSAGSSDKARWLYKGDSPFLQGTEPSILVLDSRKVQEGVAKGQEYSTDILFM